MIPHQKSLTQRQVIFVHISRILSGLPPDDHIPRISVTTNLMRLSVEGSCNHLMIPTALDCAALHTGKNLAVSPLKLPLELFLPAKNRQESLHFQSGRLCSHLCTKVFLGTDGRYPLPGSISLWVCPDFPPHLKR